MRAMAYKLFSSLKSHPLIIAFSVLLLFTLPIFHMLMFFWPLIVSTALGVLAVVSFGGQSDEHTTPIAGCGAVESVGRPEYEEKISNVLMVGNQEVTWLEWLHNEDTQKICAKDCEPAVCDAHGFDVSSIASVASVVDAPAEDKLSVYANGSTCEDEAIDNTSLCAEEKGRLYVCGGEDDIPANAVVLIEEDGTRMSSTTSTVLDGCRGATNVLEDVNRTKTAEDETDLDSTEAGKDQMCRFGLTCEDETKNVPKGNGFASTVNKVSDTRASACAEGDERQIRVEGLYQTGGGGNECKPTQGLLDSTTYIQNGADGYAYAGGDEVVGNVDALVLGATKSHALTIDSEGVMNKCVSASGIEGETSLHVPVSTLKAEIAVDALDFPSPTAAISHISEPKFAHIYEKNVLDLPSSSKTVSPLLKMEGAEEREMQHVDEQDEEERDSKQLVTQGPQWDVSDGEEDQSSLRFSFFHNRSFMPSKA